ncbi:vWA domain-containing protein [Hydrogenimonas cancrithermarum]|uniref:VWA domain-containing protein n=1 Tax=Hydrogenimonas cancrithermarum TaxID=2993563 RepID=A0ABN6WTY6_9BACT|nr:VWA domain-containing protein [Hydrogenimonas cancrithermarum]BDY12565.1 hypothetical protein HCR_08770 [Hydrogenimonas cancrithermarum]
MRFLYPEFIYLMLIPAAVLIYLISTNKDVLERIFKPEALERLRISGDALGRAGHNTLLFIAFLFMSLALAQPVIEQGAERVKTKGVDLVIALDLSRSMRARDFFPNRLTFAKQKIREILPTLPAGRVGMVGFTSASFIVAPLTTDRDALVFLLDRLDPKSVTVEGTALLAAIRGGEKLLKKSEQKTILLVTDGGDDVDTASLSERLKKEKIRLIVWMVATRQGAPVAMSDRETAKGADEKIFISRANTKLRDVAQKSGGRYIEATLSQEDEKQIENFLKELADSGQQYEKVVHHRIQLFYYPLALALLVLPFGLYSVGRGSHAAVLLLFSGMFCAVPKAEAGLLDFRLIEQGAKAYREGHYKESVEVFEKLSLKSPKSEVWFDLGNSYYKSGRYKMALDAYEKVVTSDTAIEKAKLYNMANCYVRLGELEKAAELYRKVLKMGKDVDAKANLELVLKALREQKKKKKGASGKGKGKKKNQKESASKPAASKEQSDRPGSQRQNAKTRKMSEAEEKKWMQLIRKQPLKAKLYPLTPPEEVDHVNPW